MPGCFVACKYQLKILHGKKERFQGGRAWIVSHGWQDNTDSWATNIGNSIHSKYPKDTVILLDWREASAGPGLPNEKVPRRQATWVTPISKDAVKRLGDWGLNDRNNIMTVGHSLGTLIATELSIQYGGVKMTNLISPPGNIATGYYVVDLSSGRKISTFAGTSQFSRSFVANDAGDDINLARTADEKVFINTIDANYAGESHNSTPRVFNHLISDKETLNGHYSLNNLNNNNFSEMALQYGSFDALIQATGKVDSAKNETLELMIDNRLTALGTKTDDRVVAYHDDREIIFRGGGGGDEFWNHNLAFKSLILVDDFSDDRDRISLKEKPTVLGDHHKYTLLGNTIYKAGQEEMRVSGGRANALNEAFDRFSSGLEQNVFIKR